MRTEYGYAALYWQHQTIRVYMDDDLEELVDSMESGEKYGTLSTEGYWQWSNANHQWEPVSDDVVAEHIDRRNARFDSYTEESKTGAAKQPWHVHIQGPTLTYTPRYGGQERSETPTEYFGRYETRDAARDAAAALPAHLNATVTKATS